jgi:hypothetical protein
MRQSSPESHTAWPEKSNFCAEAQSYLWECWGARLVKEFGVHPNLDWQLLVLLIYIDKNTQVLILLTAILTHAKTISIQSMLILSLSLNLLYSKTSFLVQIKFITED